MDKRNRNNLSLAQRRAAVSARRRRKPGRRNSVLERAVTILRQRGHTVHDAGVDEPRSAGMIRVDERKRTALWVIETAKEIVEREWIRNNELRAQHGLPPLPRSEVLEK